NAWLSVCSCSFCRMSTVRMIPPERKEVKHVTGMRKVALTSEDRRLTLTDSTPNGFKVKRRTRSGLLCGFLNAQQKASVSKRLSKHAKRLESSCLPLLSRQSDLNLLVKSVHAATPKSNLNEIWCGA